MDMKNTKRILLLIIPVILLTGCSNSLKCEIENNNQDSSIKIKFTDNKPTTYKFRDDMNFGNTLDADSELYLDNKLTQYRDLIADKYADVIERQGVVKVKIDYDFTKNKSIGENTLLISRDDTQEIAKQKIEKVGYICK